MDPDEQGRKPGELRIDAHQIHDRPENEAGIGLPVAAKHGQDRLGRKAGPGDQPIAADRFAYGQAQQQSQQQSRRADDEEHDLPVGKCAEMNWRGDSHRLCRIDRHTAQQKGHARTERCSQHEDTIGTRAQPWREIIGDNGGGGGRNRRLAHTHADARREQTAEAARQTARRGRQAPQRDAGRHDPPTLQPVDEIADRNAEDAVENTEGKALQQADLTVGDLEIGFDRLHQQTDRDAVQNGEAIGHRQDGDHIPAIGPIRPRCAGRGHDPADAFGSGARRSFARDPADRPIR